MGLSKIENFVKEVKQTRKMDISRWKEFQIGELFDIFNGKGITKSELRKYTNEIIPCIQGGEFNNGVLGYFPTKLQNNSKYCFIDEMCISLARVGSGGAVNFQEKGCFIGDKAKALVLKEEYQKYKNKFVYLFLMTLLKQFKTGHYNEGIRTEEYLKNIIILPVDKNGEPDWKYMEDYIQNISNSYNKINLDKLERLPSEIKNETKIDITKWKIFKIGELFECETAKQTLKVEDGNFPYIARSAFNNGLTKFVKEIKKKVNQENCITIGAEGFFAFYQEGQFMAGNKIYVLRHKKLNKYNGLFICSVLNSIVEKYSYNNARILDRIKNEIHKFPVDKNGEPDWLYMEDYIKKLSYRIENALK